jgi:hypothetical protein
MSDSANGYINSVHNNSNNNNDDNNDSNNTDNHIIQQLQNKLNEQETKFKLLYDNIIKENEILKNRGNESLLASQWRERYETCLREKEDIYEKLKIFSNDDEYLGKEITLKNAYMAMKDDLKVCR